MTKVCSICKLALPIEHYHRDIRGGKGGRRAQCRDCRRLYPNNRPPKEPKETKPGAPKRQAKRDLVGAGDRRYRSNAWHPALERIYTLVVADVLTVEDDPALRKGLDVGYGRLILRHLDDYEPGIGPVEFILDYIDGEAPEKSAVTRALARIDRYTGLSV